MNDPEQRLDRCDALDVLEEAVLTRRLVTLSLEGGETVTGRVVDVVTANGEDRARLEDGAEVEVGRIVQIERRLG